MLLLGLAGCGREAVSPTESTNRTNKPQVHVVSHPLEYLAGRIGGELVDVTFPVPEGVDPSYWEPDDEDIRRIQAADLLLLNGADYAKWTLRSTLPPQTVLTTREVEDRILDDPNAIVHTHGSEGEHSHEGIVAETWIDPRLAIAQAEVIKEQLAELLPESSEAIEANFAQLKDDLQQLDGDLAAAFERTSSRWMASAPAFRYLARRYDLSMEAFNWPPTEPPSDEAWEEFDARLDGNPAPMLWTAEPDESITEALRDRGVRVVVFRLGTVRDASRDYLAVMRENVLAIEATVAERPRE